MSRRRQPNTKHGRKRPDSIAPPDDPSVGQDDAPLPGVGVTDDGTVTAVARRSDELLNGADEQDNGRGTPGQPANAPAERRPKTPPAIDPDAPTSVLPVSELPA